MSTADVPPGIPFEPKPDDPVPRMGRAFIKLTDVLLQGDVHEPLPGMRRFSGTIEGAYEFLDVPRPPEDEGEIGSPPA